MRAGFTMKEVMEWFPQAEARGQYAGSIQRIAALKEARPGDLTFLASLKFQALARSTDASVILAPPDFDHKPKHQQMILLVENPSRVLADICGRIQARNLPPRKSGIHPSATIDPSARIDPSAWIGPHCVVEAGAVIGPDCELAAQVFVGRNVQIGKASQLRPQVVVEPDSIIGERCILHPGVVIGADGFGYESSSKGHHKIPQIGCVVVEDEVEIGANSTVDRARFAETRIGRGTKIDNLVQIGHNVVIGKHGIFCGASGVSGSARIGDFVTVAGQVGIVGHIEIGDRVMIGGQSGVSRNLPSDSVYSGTPARPLIEQRRLEGWLRRLPEIHKSIKQLEKKIGKNVDE